MMKKQYLMYLTVMYLFHRKMNYLDYSEENNTIHRVIRQDPPPPDAPGDDAKGDEKGGGPATTTATTPTTTTPTTPPHTTSASPLSCTPSPVLLIVNCLVVLYNALQ